MSPPRKISRTAAVERRIGATVLVAVPGRDEIRILGPTASLVWSALREPGERSELEGMLRAMYPDVPEEDRVRAVDEILSALVSDGLVSVT